MQEGFFKRRSFLCVVFFVTKRFAKMLEIRIFLYFSPPLYRSYGMSVTEQFRSLQGTYLDSITRRRKRKGFFSFPLFGFLHKCKYKVVHTYMYVWMYFLTGVFAETKCRCLEKSRKCCLTGSSSILSFSLSSMRCISCGFPTHSRIWHVPWRKSVMNHSARVRQETYNDAVFCSISPPYISCCVPSQMEFWLPTTSVPLRRSEISAFENLECFLIRYQIIKSDSVARSDTKGAFSWLLFSLASET